ncbi:MAG: NCS1 family nucleobase:cation symporter-1 [Candidatus Sumerlaeaceae bacterium]|nr:NCS1 family nucleobase:cation symporter-1 [Candidatus Sumerlaeaceae bacterium]
MLSPHPKQGVTKLSDITSSPLYNEDLAPVPVEKRTWGMWTIASLWVGMVVCITTYMFAAGMINQGMTWRQALFTITLGNLIVLIPMTLNAHAGTKYGIPFPVLVRSSFGTLGANVPALMRAIVACGWFGIQTYIGGAAIYTIHAKIFGFAPAVDADRIRWLGLSWGELGCFLLFWAVNIAIIVMGTEAIKWLENLSAPFLIIVGVALLAWSVSKAGGFGVVLSDETVAKARGNLPKDFDFWKVFWPNLTGTVAYWATLSLNIPDFTRYCRTQKDQMLGQLIGLPTTMALYSFIGIAVTCATVINYGEAIWDPVKVLAKLDNVFVVGFALFALTIATLTTNIAANVVSPANDFFNICPRLISFKVGGIITGVIGVLILPWKLFNDLNAYVFTWLIGYGTMLGAIAGVMLSDYFVIRKASLDVEDLYRLKGRYQYMGGFNWRALVAVAAGIATCVPGFINQFRALGPPETAVPVDPEVIWNQLYTHSWFVSFGVAAVVHVLLSLVAPPARSEAETKAV